MFLSEESVLNALRQVQDPDLHRDIVSLNFVKDLVIENGKVSFKIELTTPACPVKDLLQEEARAVVAAINGVAEVEIEMTARVRERNSEPEDLIPSVKNCIAIASGKGGVGKSTVTVNLAIALAQKGAKVGLLDADVYGPSIPMLMGVEGERPLTRNSKIVPIERFGVKMMSLGFLLEEGQAVLWRGPMVASTVKQLLADVLWGELDYLLVDLPPGTGDAPMSLAQLVPLSGVVIVTTPHRIAANIAGKAAQLFTRLNTKLVGVIENMATYECPSCGKLARIFAGSSGQELAETLGCVCLGSIPVVPPDGEVAEIEIPFVIAAPESIQSHAFREAAGAMASQISILSHPKESQSTHDMAPVGSE